MLGETIKSLRTQKGLSQEELAAQLHVVRQTVSKWEQNRSVPDARMLEELSRVLDVPVTDLLGQPPREAQASLEAMSVQLTAIHDLLQQQQRQREKRCRWLLRLPAILLSVYLLMVGFDFLSFKFSNDPYMGYHFRPWWEMTNFTQSFARYDGYGYDAWYNISKTGEIQKFGFEFLGKRIYVEER